MAQALIQLKMTVLGYVSMRPRASSWKTVGWRHRVATKDEHTTHSSHGESTSNRVKIPLRETLAYPTASAISAEDPLKNKNRTYNKRQHVSLPSQHRRTIWMGSTKRLGGKEGKDEGVYQRIIVKSERERAMMV